MPAGLASPSCSVQVKSFLIGVGVAVRQVVAPMIAVISSILVVPTSQASVIGGSVVLLQFAGSRRVA